jgi:hypothetical protein
MVLTRCRTWAAARFPHDLPVKPVIARCHTPDIISRTRHNPVVRSTRKDAEMPPSQHGSTLVRRSFLLAPLAWALPARARPAIPPSLLQHGAKLLATLIQSARESAIAGGVKPVPPQIHRALLGFFPDAILRKARYTSGHADAIALPGVAMSYGHIDAVTLGDVIMFRDDHAARTDSKLWAHELTHVMQYERWGIDGFATRYLQDYEAVELEARDNADRYVSWSEHAHG